MTREGHLCSHESPSYKVNNHPYTSRYKYTYIIHNATTQREKVNQTLPTFQRYGPARYRKYKQTLSYSGNAAQAKSRKSKGSTWRGTPIHALEKRPKDGDRRT